MALRIPKELKPCEGEMSIYRKGNCWIVEPVQTKCWPQDFFKEIRIEASDFVRPDQGVHRDID